MGNDDMVRENFKIPKAVSEKLAELAQAMDKSKTELLIIMVNAEYERRGKLLETYRKTQAELAELRK